ncbi:MAG: bifunctional nuclease family protein [Muribaculaceae bacterium]|nr:bifunctional nuclease family protein [Muribaculaceae bacterium]
MDKRISLRVLGLSQSQFQSDAYALILTEIKGVRCIPVVIGVAEAQSIAIVLEGIKTPRPLTHDTFVSFAHAFGVKLKEVFIYRFEDGIFSSELTFSDGERSVVIDARTSDAIALALRTDAPIYTTAEIIETTGFVIDVKSVNNTDEITLGDAETDDNTASENDDFDYSSGYQAEPKPENYSIEQLEATLVDLIDKEEYEEAARISEILQAKKDKQNETE